MILKDKPDQNQTFESLTSLSTWIAFVDYIFLSFDILVLSFLDDKKCTYYTCTFVSTCETIE